MLKSNRQITGCVPRTRTSVAFRAWMAALAAAAVMLGLQTTLGAVVASPLAWGGALLAAASVAVFADSLLALIVVALPAGLFIGSLAALMR